MSHIDNCCVWFNVNHIATDIIYDLYLHYYRQECSQGKPRYLDDSPVDFWSFSLQG